MYIVIFCRDLPLPESIVKLFGTNADDADDPNEHCGRIRTFAHEKGNWATAIHIPCKKSLLQSFFIAIFIDMKF